MKRKRKNKKKQGFRDARRRKKAKIRNRRLKTVDATIIWDISRRGRRMLRYLTSVFHVQKWLSACSNK
ncbi:MAG TPA: hypothetical protein ENF76_01070 [Candidatus Bathyarchaeota archaeon]|nr:hypothetical protein [Candidatus Bathyarchaeota archaeon]